MRNRVCQWTGQYISSDRVTNCISCRRVTLSASREKHLITLVQQGGLQKVISTAEMRGRQRHRRHKHHTHGKTKLAGTSRIKGASRYLLSMVLFRIFGRLSRGASRSSLRKRKSFSCRSSASALCTAAAAESTSLVHNNHVSEAIETPSTKVTSL